MEIVDPLEPTFKLHFGELTPEHEAELLAKAKAAFSATELQRCTEEDDGIPMVQVIEELDRIHGQISETR